FSSRRRHTRLVSDWSSDVCSSDLRPSDCSQLLPLISLSYIVAMAFLALHLWHGGSSWLQSLGLASPRGRSVAAAIGPILAVAVRTGEGRVGEEGGALGVGRRAREE